MSNAKSSKVSLHRAGDSEAEVMSTKVEAKVAELQKSNYVNEEDLVSVQDCVVDSKGEAVATGRWAEIGERIEGLFQGLELHSTIDKQSGQARPFVMALFRTTDATGLQAMEKIFCPVALASFFFTYEFPVGEFLRVEYIGARPIPGRNPMKQFRYSWKSTLNLEPVADGQVLSVGDMRALYSPKRKKNTVAVTE